MKKIAVIGLRGHGVIYSGYETFIRHLVAKSSKKNFFYYLYCRSKYQRKINKKNKKNYRLIMLPTISGKYLETFFYVIFSTYDSLSREIDTVLYLGTAYTYLIFIHKLLGRKVVANTAGVDWNKKRWSLMGKIYLKICEQMTVWFANLLICDSRSMVNYYRGKYRLNNLIYVPYGAEVKSLKPGKMLKRFDLRPMKYMYAVGRFSPENCLEDLIMAFRKFKTDFKCVIVGDSFYEEKYKKYLMNLAKNDKRIIFTGILQGKEYDEICSNSLAYVETKSIGGTHPALLEAMAFGKCVIVKDTKENQEVIGDSGYLYNNFSSLRLEDQLKYVISHPKNARRIGNIGKKRVHALYNWKDVISRYEAILK